MTVTLIRGDARHLPLADDTVDLSIFSPPYFGLRSYQDGGEHYDGQLGSEATPTEFVDALIAVTQEVMRVLKPSGSLFVNLGDKYSGAPSGPRQGMPDGATRRSEAHVFRERTCRQTSVAAKSLMGLPWRYALRCIGGSSGLTPDVVKMLLRDVALGVMSLADAEAMVDEIDRTDPDDLGLILRAEIVLDKKNGLPESVTDRVRRSHEQVFHFVKQPRYYSAVDEIREEHSGHFKKYAPTGMGGSRTGRDETRTDWASLSTSMGVNPLGKLPGSVWEYVSQPFTAPPALGIDHYAAFNMALPRRIIRGWSPAGICTACGEGRRPVVERAASGRDRSTTSAKDPSWVAINRADWQENVTRTITGYVCACPDTTAPTRPSVILDPFSGTGTTALVASVLGRHGIGVDMSFDYSRLAKWRTQDPGERAKAMQVDKPPTEVDGQGDLFGEMSA